MGSDTNEREKYLLRIGGVVILMGIVFSLFIYLAFSNPAVLRNTDLESILAVPLPNLVINAERCPELLDAEFENGGEEFPTDVFATLFGFVPADYIESQAIHQSTCMHTTLSVLPGEDDAQEAYHALQDFLSASPAYEIRELEMEDGQGFTGRADFPMLYIFESPFISFGDIDLESDNPRDLENIERDTITQKTTLLTRVFAGEQCGTITTIYLFAAKDEDGRLQNPGIFIDEEGFAEYARRVMARVERLVCPHQN